jgi:hypothetical protein
MNSTINIFRGSWRILGITLRVLLAWLIFAGPVSGVSQARLESTATFSSGAGIVLLSALQRAN